MTDDLFSRDAYLATCAATVVGATDDGVVLDRTVFYARGGGQPGDTGVLRWGEHVTPVTDTVKARETGEIVHLVEGDAPAVGSEVTCDIDWLRRYLHMRTHTALHSLSGIIFADYTLFGALRYVQVVEGFRPDIRLLPRRFFVPARVEWVFENGHRLPIYVAGTDRGYYDFSQLNGQFRLVPSGPIFEVRPKL